ncbi:MAG TPA: hypothetical protein VGF23_18415 [Gaiellaceae bacterium]|jgi:hypothetical protein
MQIEQLIPAETGWKAVFAEPDGAESVSRILGWAVRSGDGGGVVGLIVNPEEPSQVVAAVDASSPDGGTFSRYRFVAPDPLSVKVEAPPPPPAPDESESAAEQVAKGLLKRGRK